MRKRKLLIFITLILIFILLLVVILKRDTQIRQTEIKRQLEQAVNKSYAEDDKLDISKLKDNIESDVTNAKIVNKDTAQFPVHTTVNEYDFKIDENGNVETGNPADNSEQENTNNNDKQDENAKNPEPIVKYKNDTQTGKGIQISTTEDGNVTINGKSTEKLFIKISNNIQISNTADDFEKWKQQDGIIIEKGKNIKQKVTMINNPVTQGQVNAVLRTEDNEAFGILKLAENETEYVSTVNKNIIANYIYIDKGVQIDNMQFKIEITEQEIKYEQMQPESKTDKGIECAIDKDGIITLNGTSTQSIYIKISNGMNITSDGDENTQIATIQPII